MFVLFGTVLTSAPRIIPFSQQVAEVMLISLPHATGLPFTIGGQPVCGNADKQLENCLDCSKRRPCPVHFDGSTNARSETRTTNGVSHAKPRRRNAQRLSSAGVH